jgi:hypothetical protein
MRRSHLFSGNFSTRLLLICVLGCACCSTNSAGSSDAFLEKLSSNGQWLNTGTKLTAANPLIGKIEDTVIATFSFRNRRLFSGETLVLQAKLFDFQPKAHFIEGFAFGELAGNMFQGQRVECKSVSLLRNKAGKLLIEGMFIVGRFRIELPPTEAQPAESFQDAFIRLGEFDGDRIPLAWEMKNIIDGMVFGARMQYTIPGLKSPFRDAKVLTWKICTRFPWPNLEQIGHCVLWIHSDNPNQWILAHLAHTQWGISPWFLASAEHSAPFYIKLFDHPPKSYEIEEFLNENEWWEAGNNWWSHPEAELLDAEVCSNAWEKVTGQKPKRTFKKHSISSN